MVSFQLEIKNGKFNFDKALKQLGGNHQALTNAIQRFAKLGFVKLSVDGFSC
jgi:hypothetical protein